jgi:hypothetical protein
MTKEIPLSRGMVAIVDDDDYIKLIQFKWSIGEGRGKFYAVSRPGPRRARKELKMHRLILGLGSGNKIQVDHINGNTLDNRKSNLRCCNHSQNKMNSPKQVGKGTSMFKGVYKRKGTSKWCAQIKVNQRPIALGYYDTEKEAARVYDMAAIIHHGEFARLNFPLKKEIG